jgi:hypothetical protein
MLLKYLKIRLKSNNPVVPRHMRIPTPYFNFTGFKYLSLDFVIKALKPAASLNGRLQFYVLAL